MFDHTLARTTANFPAQGQAHTLEDLLTRATEATRALAEVLAAEMVRHGAGADSSRYCGCGRLAVNAGPMTNNAADIIDGWREIGRGDPTAKQSEKWRNK